MDRIKKYLKFIREAAKLKEELRHCWLSKGRRESVPEHCWMISLLAIILAKELSFKVDLLKVVKMLVIHDLGEVYNGDIPSWENSERKKNKYEDERVALNKLLSYLPDKNLQKEIRDLWNEFEKQETREANYAQAMDKLEGVIQHDIANLDTWTQEDYDVTPYYRNELFDFDKFLEKLKEAVDKMTMEKLEKAGKLHRIPKKHLRSWKKQMGKGTC